MTEGQTVNRPACSAVREKRETSGGRGISLFLLCTLLLLGLSTLTAYASGGEGANEGPNWFNLVWRTFNFLILVGILYWLLAKKIRGFFTERRDGIQSALADAATARQEAEDKFRQYEAKLEKATGEIDEIARMIQAQGLTEKQRMIEDARKAADKMREDTQARMEQEFNKASRELRVEAIRLSTQMAGEILQKNIRVDDHEAMVKDYIEKVVSTK